jgi:hypothetical protein
MLVCTVNKAIDILEGMNSKDVSTEYLHDINRTVKTHYRSLLIDMTVSCF